MEKVPRDRRPVALGDLQHLPDELLCRIVSLLAPKDVGSMACVSSIMYVFCNEEPLWMHLCLDNHEGLLEYKGSWKLTTLEKLGLVTNRTNAFDKAPLHFDGFTSLYLYRRWYRCHMALEAFIIPGVLERREKVTQEEFTALYDGRRPVLLTDLTEDWAAKDSWTIPHFVENYGDVAFKVGQSHGKKVTMRFRDYAAYMTQQHDEDPLYIFDSKFGKHAPALLQDYQVPYLFQEDFLALLGDQRPAFRWLVIGPARSGASWHVDPGLTSAWNTLLCGRKRWALYPPGRVPPQVTVHVDEEDGDVNFDGPSSLQWWVDVYPSLKDEDKPIECIQYPGETIYVPSGWWHCVLNIDSSVAVTQNVVNSANLELVCLDMAPGFRHKGVARAGGMALGQAPLAPTYRAVANSVRTAEAALDGYTEQRVGISVDDDHDVEEEELDERGCSPLDATLLLAHTQEHPDHFTSTSGGNYLGQRVLRRWLRKLWADRTDLRPRIWNCACAVLDAETWVHRAICVCEAYGLPVPSGLERLPVGNGSNPVFVVGDKVIKFYVEEGPEGSVDVLGSELQFYAQVAENESPLLHAIPALVGSGILYPDGDKFRAVPWDGRGDIPRAHHASSSGRKRGRDSAAAQEVSSEARVRTKWSRTGNLPDGAPGDAPQAGAQNSSNNSSNFLFWPYIVMERCSGRSLLSLLSEHASVDMPALASFLGQQVRNLHTLALPNTLSSLAGLDPPCVPEAEGSSQWAVQVPWEWHHFVSMLREKQQHITEQFDEWSTIPDHLVKQVETYLPTDPATAIDYLEVEGNVGKSVQPPVWIHTDIMVDNILMKEEAVEAATCGAHADGDEDSIDASSGQGAAVVSGPGSHAEASHIIDFGDINFGDPLYDFIAVYLDVFQGDVELMKRFLHEYRLPFWAQPHSGGDRPRRLSYKAMCYVLLYRIRPGRVLMHMKERMQQAGSWEEVEQQIFGFLNHWQQQEQQQQQQM